MPTEHTPGPWEWTPEGLCQMVNGKVFTSVLFPALYDRQPSIDWQNNADEKLIAAAPDLLEALNAVIKGWERGALSDAMFDPIAQARAAVAKATQP